MYLDLEEIEAAFRGRWLWSAGIANVVSFWREDYLGDARISLMESVRRVLTAAGLGHVRGPVRLLTQPRYFGFVMNPVSFYYCFGSDGQTLEAVVAEVTSTPWKERHAYVLETKRPDKEARLPRPRANKELHVSPFLPMDMEYRWQVSRPGRKLGVRIQNFRQGKAVFEATLRLSRREWTTTALLASLCRYPLMTQRVAAAIYWQAWKLWWKGCPVYPHPNSRAAGSPELPTASVKTP